MSRERHRVFGSLRVPGAPPALRQPTLSAALSEGRAGAGSAAGAESPTVTLTDRLWTSRPLRFAWAASVVALVGVNVWLDAETGHRPVRGAQADLAVAAGGRGEAGPGRTLFTVRAEVLEVLFAAEPAEPEKDPLAHLPRRAS